MSVFQPPIFVSHGAPDLALADIPAARFMRGLFKERTPPAGILIVSAHWQTRDLAMTTSANLGTIHDFGGFQRALYEISYPARSAAWLGGKIKAQLTSSGVNVREEGARGLDHGAWVPLRLMFPDAAIPIVQLSLLRGAAATDLFTLGRSLAPLADDNILILGSGASVHNLWHLGREGGAPPDWAKVFDTWTDQVLRDRDWKSLCDFDGARFSAMAHPTPEHFLPLVFTAGAGRLQDEAVRVHRLHHSFSYGSIGMSSWEFAHAA